MLMQQHSSFTHSLTLTPSSKPFSPVFVDFPQYLCFCYIYRHRHSRKKPLRTRFPFVLSLSVAHTLFVILPFLNFNIDTQSEQLRNYKFTINTCTFQQRRGKRRTHPGTVCVCERIEKQCTQQLPSMKFMANIFIVLVCLIHLSPCNTFPTIARLQKLHLHVVIHFPLVFNTLSESHTQQWNMICSPHREFSNASQKGS